MNVRDLLLAAARVAYQAPVYDPWDEQADGDNDRSCPACGTDWLHTAEPCPGCGATLADVAAGLAREVWAR